MKMNSTRILSALVLTSLSACAAVAITAEPVRAAEYHLINKLAVGGDGGWDYIYLDSQDRRLYITRGTHVMVLDVDTDKVIGDIPNLNGIHGVAIDHKSGHGFISNGKANSVVIFDLKSLQKIGEVPVDAGPDAIVFDPATERVFSFNGQGHSFSAIDGATGKLLSTVPLAGKPEFPVADGHGHIYDNLEDLSEVASINTNTLQVENTWPIAPGEGPSGISIDDKTRRVFSVCDNSLLTVLDADTGKLITTLPIGNGPDACAYDPGDRTLYSPNGRDGTLSVYHVDGKDKFTLVTTLPTQLGARTMAVDLKTHHVFTVTAAPLPPDPSTPAGTRPRRSYVPGSFVVLEYGK